MGTATNHAFQLRPAAPDEAEAIVNVWFSGWREAHLGQVPDAPLAHRSPQAFRQRIPEILDNTTVATVDDRPVGLVVVTGAEIEQLYVALEHRRHGVANALLDHGESVIAHDHREAFLAVVAGNARARHFYERQGWTDTGPFDYEAWTPDGDRVPVACRRYRKARWEASTLP